MNRQMLPSAWPSIPPRMPPGSAGLPRGIVISAGLVMLLQWAALGAWAFSWLTSESRGAEGMPPLGHDLRVYWTVSWITEHLGALAAFDPGTLNAVQLRFFPSYTAFGHWLYPPTFQWLIQPLSKLPYAWAYGTYAVVSVMLFALAVRPLRRGSGWPWLVVIAFPGLWVAILAGQNSVVTLLLMSVALTYSGTRPLLAGLCGGLLVIKPQFAVLLPLWWLCGRQWRALLTMMATGMIGCALTLAWEGVTLWRAFFAAVSTFNVEVVQQGAGDIWHAMPTVFAAARLHGMTLSAAYALYALVAVPSILLTAWLWAKRASLPLRVAAAITATLLCQPYLLYYELVWLIVPLLCLSAGGEGTWPNARQAWLDARLRAALWLLPLQAYLVVLWTPMGQWGVVLLPALMVLIALRFLRDGLGGLGGLVGVVGVVLGAFRTSGSEKASHGPSAHNGTHRL
ncbi:glycosyltransferase family 87 protein [Pandoraea anhela]|uniref:DUF2029 domain-containing protein n=1 Tax=Pandoraea anhela TaxID=2508295 RepID=A0A5E4TX66_9BURK|nr:glycosyltransferase family 87 protein [Pandoraea anhela]VVD92440.1 hypothetical protein PAN31108_01689 [Pandoraea anhela]